MKKFDYYYASCIGKMLTGSEWLLKAFVPTNSKDLVKKLNIAYGDDKYQKLDIFYQNNSTNEKLPIFFYIHGGGFVSGTMALRRTYCCTMARQGFFVVNVGYSLAPQKQFPNQLSDIFKAIEYVYELSDKYNLDTNKIVLGGESAGAYFASYIAAITKNKELFSKNSIDFCRENEFKISSLVLINGAYSINEILKAKAPFCKSYVKAFFNLTNKDLKNKDILNCNDYSPLNYIKNNFPPTIVIRGKYDAFDLGTKTLLKVLNDEEVEYSLYTTKGVAGLHAVSIVPISKDAIKAQKFTAEKLKEYLKDNDL